MKKPDLFASTSHGSLAQARKELFEEPDEASRSIESLPDGTNSWLTFLWCPINTEAWSEHAEPFYFNALDGKDNETRAIERVRVFRVETLDGAQVHVARVKIVSSNPFAKRDRRESNLAEDVRKAARRLRKKRSIN